MEEQVEIARKAEDRLRRKEKFKRLSLEKLQVDMSIKNLQQQRSNGKISGKKVNTSSLRGIQDVVEKVDSMMNDKLKFDSSSSSSEGDSYVTLSSGEEKISKRKSRRKKRKETNTKHKSGKDRTPTSYVKFPQDWPHSFLSLQFVSKNKKYEDLSLAEFCAGYCSILETISDKQLVLHRISHFKDLMYLTRSYQWKYILEFHASVLLEIERGNLAWDSDFQKIQNSALAGGCLLMCGAPSSSESDDSCQRKQQ